MPNKNVEVMTSSVDMDWQTPQAFVDDLPFDFTLDVCATLESAKCEEYISPRMDALHPDRRWPGVCFMNPPYSHVESFMQKAVEESERGSIVVALVAARTETKWFHLIWKHASLICFLGRRIKFTKPETSGGGKTAGAPFPNVVAVFGDLAPDAPWNPGAAIKIDRGPEITEVDLEPDFEVWKRRNDKLRTLGDEMSKLGVTLIPEMGNSNLWLHGEKAPR